MNHRITKFAIIFIVASLVALPCTAQSSPLAPDFTPSPANPVFNRASEAVWGGECGTIFAPQVIEHEGVYYLFYSGSCERSGRPAAIGFAASPDGVQWQVYQDNPILQPDGDGYDAMCISIGVPMFEDGQWVLYYAANSTPCAGPGQHIGRASAPDPEGPWQRSSTPVLEAGASGEWDAGFIMPHAIIHTEQGYVMFYSGGEEFLLPLPRQMGMATSPDGMHWTKYDDPSTTEPPFDHSDPLIEIQADGKTIPLQFWSADVGQTSDGWEMFFSLAASEADGVTAPTILGYGTSSDAIHWFLNRDQPVLTQQQVNQDWASSCICHPAFVRHGSQYQLYFTGCTQSLNDCQIGLATGTIGSEQP